MALPTITSRDIQGLLNEVNAAGSALIDDHADASPVPDGAVRGRLLAAAQNLVTELQNPMEKLVEISWQSHQNAVIRSCSELGIFELVPQSGKVNLQELVDKTGADRLLLYRLMRTLTATGIFTEAGAETYSHNRLSLACAGPTMHLLKHFLKLPEYLQRTAYGTRPDPDGFQSAFQYAENTKLDCFEWLKTRPEQLKTFNLAMESRSDRTLQTIQAYPFGPELGLNPSSTEDEVLLVDVGGGHGQKVLAMRARFPDLKGRMIVQDLKETIDEIQDPKGFEHMVHDFFTPQPVKGARAYFFGWILHDWSDHDCHRILSNTISAMRPGHSRILIGENVLPDTGVPPLPALLDINMMLIGGMERGRKQWVELLAPLGLEIFKIWNDGIASVIEARLKQ
ncbi:MAG: hypothetical protein M1813_007932 [Trichoglossum hirsutum]|nr:MAG: hypothetical protein M1813_007932 [Trichoglossum hirsutum]